MSNILKVVLVIVGLCVIIYMSIFVVENRNRKDPCESYATKGPCPY